MSPRTRPLTLLSGSLLLAGLLSCTGEPPAVGYGPGKAEVEQHAAEAAKKAGAAEVAKAKAHAHAQVVGTPATHHSPSGPPNNQPPKSDLPKEPRPDIAYDPPFGGAPVAATVLSGGVKAEDFVIGEGPEAAAGAAVDVHYTGYLTDGTVFDSSIPRSRPFSFELGAGRVIQGWDVGIAGMRVGGKRRLIIPAELGYGPRAAGKIPPNSTLVFTVELVSMTPPLPPPQPLSSFEGTPVKTTKAAGGLELIDYKLGEGAEVKEGDELKVHYRGTLDDGTEFDNSHPRGKPIAFVIGRGQVIKGWDQGIVGMKVGGLRKLVIPADLAYGERARGKIPANARLTFLVEVMATKSLPPPPAIPHGGRPAHATPPPAGKPATHPGRVKGEESAPGM